MRTQLQVCFIIGTVLMAGAAHCMPPESTMYSVSFRLWIDDELIATPNANVMPDSQATIMTVDSNRYKLKFTVTDDVPEELTRVLDETAKAGDPRRIFTHAELYIPSQGELQLIATPHIVSWLGAAAKLTIPIRNHNVLNPVTSQIAGNISVEVLVGTLKAGELTATAAAQDCESFAGIDADEGFASVSGGPNCCSTGCIQCCSQGCVCCSDPWNCLGECCVGC